MRLIRKTTPPHGMKCGQVKTVHHIETREVTHVICITKLFPEIRYVKNAQIATQDQKKVTNKYGAD